MNKSNLKCASVQTFINGDLGKEVDNFLRGEVEITGMQIIVSGDQKIAYIDYEDRNDVAKRCEDNGLEFEDYMKKDYYHAVEVSVPVTKDLATKINETKSNNQDIETVATYYYNGVNTKNALILYASRSEFEVHEEEQKKSNEAKVKARAEELAKTAVKEPDVTASESVLDKYVSKAEGKEESTETAEVTETTVEPAVEEITKKDNKTKKVKFGKKEN